MLIKAQSAKIPRKNHRKKIKDTSIPYYGLTNFVEVFSFWTLFLATIFPALLDVIFNPSFNALLKSQARVCKFSCSALTFVYSFSIAYQCIYFEA